MNTSRSALVLGAALLMGIAATGSIARAQDTQPPTTQPQATHPHSRQAWQDRMMSRLQQKLGLTDDQVTALRDVQARHRDARIQLGRALHQANARLREQTVTGADDATLQKTTTDIQSLMTQALQLRMQTWREMAQHMTPEQRQAFAQLKFGRASS
jgi:Spy/CpxP family protein refolding chaperone